MDLHVNTSKNSEAEVRNPIEKTEDQYTEEKHVGRTSTNDYMHIFSEFQDSISESEAEIDSTEIQEELKQKLEDMIDQVESQLPSEIPTLPIESIVKPLERAEMRALLEREPKKMIRLKNVEHHRELMESVEEENRVIDEALSVQGAAFYYLSKAQMADLALKKGRNESFLMVNENSRSEDSDEMTAVKDSIITLEKLLQDETQKISYEDIQDAYNEAIDACSVYCKARAPLRKAGKKRKTMVRETMNRLIRERELFRKGVSAIERQPDLKDRVTRPMDLMNSGKMIFTEADEGEAMLTAEKFRMFYLEKVDGKKDSAMMRKVKESYTTLLDYMSNTEIDDDKKYTTRNTLETYYNEVITACDKYLNARDKSLRREDGDYRYKAVLKLKQRCAVEKETIWDLLNDVYFRQDNISPIRLAEVYGNMRSFLDFSDDMGVQFSRVIWKDTDNRWLYRIMQSLDMIMQGDPIRREIIKKKIIADSDLQVRVGVNNVDDRIRLIDDPKELLVGKAGEEFRDLLRNDVPISFLKDPKMAKDPKAREQYAAFCLPYLPSVMEYRGVVSAWNLAISKEYFGENEDEKALLDRLESVFREEGVRSGRIETADDLFGGGITEERDLLSEEAMLEYKKRNMCSCLKDVSGFVPPTFLPKDVVAAEEELREEVRAAQDPWEDPSGEMNA